MSTIDFRICKHKYVRQTKMGIPSLLPFVCKHCRLGSWHETEEENVRHEEEFMRKIEKSLKGNKDPRLQPIRKLLGFEE